MRRVFLFLSLFLVYFPALAWNMAGHHMVAKVAYHYLSDKTRTQIDKMIKPLGRAYPGYGQFTLAASWADHLKSHEVMAFNQWHYINYHFDENGKAVLKPNPQNILWAIGQMRRTLRSKKALPFEKSVALAFLVHFVGDLHQPLHVASRVSAIHPRGDKGGNLFKLSGRYQNLHALWDAGLGLYKPYNENKLVAQFIKQYPPERFAKQLKRKKPHEWAKESLQISKKRVYQGIKPLQKPSKAYLVNHQEIAHRQITLAGIRLASILEEIVAE